MQGECLLDRKMTKQSKFEEVATLAEPAAQMIRQTNFGELLDVLLILAPEDLHIPLALSRVEWTITLQDVDGLLGVLVDGLPIFEA